ncbi:MAG: hypothetical protein JNL54_06870 [Kineosporiaceae bacterium]|nr:hypothetical protein [Kineosporiaceae bacterium]
MDHDQVTGFLVLTLVIVGALLMRPKYPMQVCPTCNGDGREFERGTKNFRVCVQCGGNKSVPR